MNGSGTMTGRRRRRWASVAAVALASTLVTIQPSAAQGDEGAPSARRGADESGATSSKVVSDPFRVLVAGFYGTDQAPGSATVGHFQLTATQTADYYTTVSGGRLQGTGEAAVRTTSGTTTSWFPLPMPVANDCGHVAAKSRIAPALDVLRQYGYDPDDYDHVVVYYRQDNCAWGGGTIEGSSAVITLLDTYTAVHEIGHALGLAHMQSWDCGAVAIAATCTSAGEYSGRYDPMGQTFPVPIGFSAHHLRRLGWLSPADQVSVVADGRYEIGGLYDQRVNGRPVLLHLENSRGRNYDLSYRPARGVDSALGTPALPGSQPGVVVSGGYEFDATPGSQPDDAADGRMLVGPQGRITTPEGVTIEVVSQDQDRAVVDVRGFAWPAVIAPPSSPSVSFSLTDTDVMAVRFNRSPSFSGVFVPGGAGAEQYRVTALPNGPTTVVTPTGSNAVAVATVRFSNSACPQFRIEPVNLPPNVVSASVTTTGNPICVWGTPVPGSMQARRAPIGTGVLAVGLRTDPGWTTNNRYLSTAWSGWRVTTDIAGTGRREMLLPPGSFGGAEGTFTGPDQQGAVALYTGLSSVGEPNLAGTVSLRPPAASPWSSPTATWPFATVTMPTIHPEVVVPEGTSTSGLGGAWIPSPVNEPTMRLFVRPVSQLEVGMVGSCAPLGLGDVLGASTPTPSLVSGSWSVGSFQAQGPFAMMWRPDDVFEADECAAIVVEQSAFGAASMWDRPVRAVQRLRITNDDQP